MMIQDIYPHKLHNEYDNDMYLARTISFFASMVKTCL